MNTPRRIAVAIDGYSSTGKSTMARWLAAQVGYAYIDTGAMYRAVTLHCLNNHLIDGDRVDEQALAADLEAGKVDISFAPGKNGRNITLLGGKDVEREIRSMHVSDKVSIIAALGFVRRQMVALQQAMGRGKGVVMDGRDIGTVVLPDAELKVFVTADPDVRAQRRYDELVGKGDTEVTLEQVRQNVLERDRIDTTRAESPLRRADDALELDNSYLTIDEQNEILLDMFNKTVSALAAE